MLTQALTLTIEPNRAAIWHGQILQDLYRNDAVAANYEGAVVGAKLIRILKQTQSGYADAGLPETVYIENIGNARAGAMLTLLITHNPRHGKAYRGKILPEVTPITIGLQQPAPAPWQRAMFAHDKSRIGKILCASRELQQICLAWLAEQRPDLVPCVSIDAAAIDALGLDDIQQQLSQPRVTLKSGGEIVIEQTEALTAIDVNQGQAGNALTTNLEAVREAARQIRLRDLRGIILVDALKMTARTDQAKLLQAAKDAVASDKGRVNVFGITKLGLLEMTRQGGFIA